MRLLTKDIYEGAYLLSQGMQLEKLWQNGNNGKKTVIFEFTGADVEILRKNYAAGRAEVNITRLKHCLNDLKDCMFNLLRTEKTANSGRRNNHEQPRCSVR